MTRLGQRDARSLDHPTLEEMRRLAVRRILAGETQAAVASTLEVRESTVWKWYARFRAYGWDGLASRKASGPRAKLSERQQKQLKRIIIGKNPLQLNFGVALWTIPLVRQLIERKFGIALHETSVGRMLRRLGLTPQKPIRRAFQRDDAECRRWASEEFPRVVKEVRRTQATLLFGDETGVHENGPIGTTWGARGVRPVVRVSGKRTKVNVISFISPRGRLWFRCYKGNLTSPLFVEFLTALLRDIRGRIVLVLDSHPAHVAAATRRFVLARSNRLTVHYLPAYAPELNPDEHVWGYLKGMFRRTPLDEGEDLSDSVQRSMEHISEQRDIVRSFFDRPEVAYVKDALSW